MLQFEPWKKVVIALVLLTGVLTLTPNFFYSDVVAATDAREAMRPYVVAEQEIPQELLDEADRWPSWLPAGVVNLGLDLQGGSHFLLEIDAQDVVSERIQTLRDSIGPALREAGVRRYVAETEGDDVLTVSITNAEDVETARGVLEGLVEPVIADAFGGLTDNLEISQDGQVFQIVLTDEARSAAADGTVAAAIEVIRSRVDALGTREPVIQRQGDDRILLQLPGESDVDIAEITRPAVLEFRLVAEDVSVVDIASGDVPPGVTVFEYDPILNPDFAGQVIALYDEVLITGDQLAEASQGFDQDGLVGVNIRFDPSGARVFGSITRDNVGRRFAMVLDGMVLSAPSIRVPILDGRAIITGDFSVPSAQALAVNLSSGSLPAELSIEESSVVGPSLGQDSIDAGTIACILGFALVMVFMAVSYGTFGLLANVALILNVGLIFGALSLFGATLTLPGIAGIVLTIGMAVDANVLVFERIREELRRGRTVVRAIEAGYDRAFSAIIDANVTTFIAAAILFAMGSGPVRGFSVTLGIGILTSVFTAVMLTRFFVAQWYDLRRPKTLAL